METFVRDLKYTVRMLVKKPGFTLVAVLSLTFGIGANTTIFTLAKALFTQTVPVQEPDRLIVVYSNAVMRNGPPLQFLPMSYLNARDIRDKNDVFSGSSIAIPTGVNLVISGKQTTLFCEMVNGNFFDVIGLQPALGRWFRADEDESPGAHPVVVISYALWNRQFGADPNITNRTIQINSQIYTIVGVTPKTFRNIFALGGGLNPDFFIPIAMHGSALAGVQKQWLDERGARMVAMFGRLKPGVPIQQAESSLKNLAANLAKEYPVQNAGRGLMIMPISETTIPPLFQPVISLAATIMTVIVGLVLLIACANVANLLMVRGTERRREIAIRLSMGASRNRLIRQLLTESFLLALLAGVLGVVCAFATRSFALKFLPAGLPRNLDFGVDGSVLLFTLGLSILATILFGLMPALQSSRIDRLAILRDRSSTSSSSTRKFGLRSVLVAVQVALSLVALVGAGLFLHSLRNAKQINPGFEVNHGLTIFINFGVEHYPQPKIEQFFQESTGRLRTLPMMAGASFADIAPFSPGVQRSAFTDSAGMSDPRNGRTTPVCSVLPGFFSTAGMTLLQGRDFTDQDDAQGAQVAVINEAAARQFWPGQDPVAKHIYFLPNSDVTVVGVVNTVKYQTLGEPPQAIIYFPLKQHPTPGVYLWVRTNGDPEMALPSIRSIVQSLDPELPITAVLPNSELVGRTLALPRLGAELVGGFGLLALALATMGIYGVMSYSVGQRTQEVGLRMALGAERGQVLRLIATDGMVMVLIGIVTGLVFSILLAHFMSTLLYGIGAFDALSFLGTSLLMILVALLACWIPARRASRVDPMVALRHE
jgi:predicted permease